MISRAVVAIALIACKDKAPAPQASDPQRPRDATAASPTRGTLAIKASRGMTGLPHGRAYMSTGKLEIRLTDVDGPCGDGFPPPWTTAAFITVPPGPNGKFFAGAPFGTRVSAGNTDRSGTFSGYAPQGTRVTLEPFEAKPGTKIRGTVQLMTEGGGSFEAELCPGDYAVPALAVESTTNPLTKHALIRIDKHSDTYQQIGSLALFARPTTCDVFADYMSKYRGAPVIVLGDIGGASTAVSLAGSPQPVTFHTRPSGAGGDGWVTFESLHFEPGKKLRGTVVTPIAAGTFEAEVCPY